MKNITLSADEKIIERARKMGVDPVIAIGKMRLFKRAQVIVPDAHDVIDAARLSGEHKLSFWGAMIVTTALKADCSRLDS